MTCFDGYVSGAYDASTHKVVPKDAVVLDPKTDLSAWTADPKKILEYAGGLDDQCRLAAAELLRRIAAQVKPPRIPEPGKYAVVRDEQGEDWIRAGANEYTSHEWVNTSTFTTCDWDDIPGTLEVIRKGAGV